MIFFEFLRVCLCVTIFIHKYVREPSDPFNVLENLLT